MMIEQKEDNCVEANTDTHNHIELEACTYIAQMGPRNPVHCSQKRI